MKNTLEIRFQAFVSPKLIYLPFIFPHSFPLTYSLPAFVLSFASEFFHMWSFKVAIRII